MSARAWSAGARRVRALLDRERRLIRAGDLAGLAAHAAHARAALEDWLAHRPPEPGEGEDAAAAEAEIAAVRAAAERNRRLLEAMRAGLESGRAAAAAQEAAAARMGYARDGAPVARRPTPARDRRA